MPSAGSGSPWRPSGRCTPSAGRARPPRPPGLTRSSAVSRDARGQAPGSRRPGRPATGALTRSRVAIATSMASGHAARCAGPGPVPLRLRGVLPVVAGEVEPGQVRHAGCGGASPGRRARPGWRARTWPGARHRAGRRAAGRRAEASAIRARSRPDPAGGKVLDRAVVLVPPAVLAPRPGRGHTPRAAAETDRSWDPTLSCPAGPRRHR